jgi:hypothetical protein
MFNWIAKKIGARILRKHPELAEEAFATEMEQHRVRGYNEGHPTGYKEGMSQGQEEGHKLGLERAAEANKAVAEQADREGRACGLKEGRKEGRKAAWERMYSTAAAKLDIVVEPVPDVDLLDWDVLKTLQSGSTFLSGPFPNIYRCHTDDDPQYDNPHWEVRLVKNGQRLVYRAVDPSKSYSPEIPKEICSLVEALVWRNRKAPLPPAGDTAHRISSEVYDEELDRVGGAGNEDDMDVLNVARDYHRRMLAESRVDARVNSAIYHGEDPVNNFNPEWDVSQQQLLSSPIESLWPIHWRDQLNRPRSSVQRALRLLGLTQRSVRDMMLVTRQELVDLSGIGEITAADIRLALGYVGLALWGEGVHRPSEAQASRSSRRRRRAGGRTSPPSTNSSAPERGGVTTAFEEEHFRPIDLGDNNNNGQE